MTGLIRRYFGGSILVSLLGLVLVFILTKRWNAVYLALVLSFLELSLSFDNAVVNAKMLQHMSPQWQKRFIWWGILIAVVGMRLIFPILLVYASTSQSLYQVIYSALYNPSQYAHALEAGYPLISAFGGSFLLMVFLHFVSKIAWLPALISLAVGAVFITALWRWSILFAYVLGVVIYEVLHQVSARMMHKAIHATASAAKVGLIGFIYLEVLDASFSFDGVIAAFAISTDIIVIMVGLGIGALFVRSLTIYFVERKTLAKLIYLEYGAYYAIGFLAIVMLVKNFIHIPEWISGTVGLLMIAIALVASIQASG
jgi:hypothetical protein